MDLNQINAERSSNGFMALTEEQVQLYREEYRALLARWMGGPPPERPEQPSPHTLIRTVQQRQLVLSAGDVQRVIQWAQEVEHRSTGLDPAETMLLRQLEHYLYPSAYVVGPVDFAAPLVVEPGGVGPSQ